MNTHPTTDYFRNDILLKRPYIQLEWYQAALFNPVYSARWAHSPLGVCA
jgi:hypothetical protein